MKKKSSFLQKVFSVMTVTVLLSQQVLPILVYAQSQSTDNVENIPTTITPTEVTVEPTNTPSPTPIPNLTPEVAITTDNSEIIIPKIDNGLNLEKYFVPTPTMNLDIVGKLQTFSNIVVNNVYVYALNSDVSVKFTKLPVGTNLSFTIEEVSVNLDGKTLTGYDIKSDMVDGEFSYELVLPNTVGQNAEVQYSEDGSTFNDVQNEKLTLDTVAVNADHFTIFVVVILQPNYASPGSGGVLSAYVGPPDYGYVSPGVTALYNGREAGIIKAGLNVDANGHYWDEGLFAFIPTVTIDTFAAGTVTYDVVNEAGINPVWMTIEIDTGVVGDRNDNTIYQFVPTSNPASWHTVNAGAGLWQKWNDGAGDTTGNSLISLSSVATAHSGLNVVRAYLRLGMGDSYYNGGTGTIAWVATATFGGETYDFSITSVTTKAATGVTSNDATLNAFNKSAATGHSFWVSLAPFVTTSSTIPDGVYSTPDLGSIAANADFSATLASITTTGVPTNLPDVTPNTTYYFAAWSLVGGTWYPGEIMTFVTANGPVFIDTNVNGTFDSGELSFNTIQAAITAASANDTIHVTAGIYTEIGQIVIDKNLSIVGADKATTIIKPAQDTGDTGSGDGRGWLLTHSGTTFSLSGVTLDGVGKNVCIGLYDYSLGTIQDVNVKNIGCAKYYGRAIYLKNNATIRNVRIENSERIGVFVWQGATAAIIDKLTYVGKGAGDYLDYGIEVEGGSVTITDSMISNVLGIAAAPDNSDSAAFLATTGYGPSNASIDGLTVINSSNGIAVGYDSSDTSTVTVHNSNLSGALLGVVSTAPTVDATNNWWGDASGPEDTISGDNSILDTNPNGIGSAAIGAINYAPWYTDEGMITLTSAYPTTEVATDPTITGATVHGTNGDYDASNTSFWWGTSSAGPFTPGTDPGSSQLPPGWTHDSGTGAALAGGSFSEVLTGLTSGTPYYFVAWSLVDGTWYPGVVLNFITILPDTTAPTITDFNIQRAGDWNNGLILNQKAYYDSTDTYPIIGNTVSLGANFQDAEGNLVTSALGVHAAWFPGGTSSWSGIPFGNYQFTWNTLADARYNYTTSANDTADGIRKVMFYAQDGISPTIFHTTNEEYYVIVDNTAPTVNYGAITPADGSIFRASQGTIKIDGDFADNYGLYDVRMGIAEVGWDCFWWPSNVNTNDTPANGNHSCDVDISSLSDGTYHYAIQGLDKARNTNNTFTRSFVIDNTAPSVPVNGAPNGSSISTNNFDFNWDNSTDSSLPITYLFQSSQNLTQVAGVLTTGLWTSAILPTNTIHSSGAPDGTWYWQVQAIDAVGNRSAWSQIWTVTLDTVAPTIVFSGVKDQSSSAYDGSAITKPCGSFNSTGFISWEWSLANVETNPVDYLYTILSGPAEVGFSTTTQNTNVNGGVPAEGDYVVSVTGTDSVGHVGNTVECSITFDNSAPTISIDSVKYGLVYVPTFITNDNNPTFVGIYQGDHLGTINVNLNGIDIPIIPTGGTWEADFSAASLPDGTYTITATITDLAENSSTDTQVLVIDTVAPSAEYTYYKNGTTVTTPIAYVQDVTELSFTAQYLDSDPSSGLNTDSYVIFQAQDDHSFDFAANGKLSYCGWRSLPNLVTIPAGGALTTPVSFTNCISTLLEGEYYLTHQVYDNATRNDIPSINQYSDVLGLHFIVDRTDPKIDTIPNQSYNEGSYIDNLEILNGKGITDDQKLDTFYFDIDYTPFVSSPSVNLLSTSFDISGVNGDGKGGTLNELIDYVFDATDFEELNGLLPIDTSISPEGVYTFTYWAYDMAGNHSTCNENLEPTIGSASYSSQIGVENSDCSFTVTINNVNPTVTLNTDQTINEGQPASFTGSFTDPSYLADSPFYNPDVLGMLTQSIDTLPISETATPNTPDDANWIATINYGEGAGIISIGSFPIPGVVTIPNHIYVNNGVYTTTLTVCEGTETHNTEFYGEWGNLTESDTTLISGEGNCDSNSVQVTVNNVVPTVSITANPSNNVAYGTAVILTAAGLGGNAQLTYLWSGACSGTNQTYTLPGSTGTYSCTVIVTDADGDTASANSTVVVRAAVVPARGNTTIPEQLSNGIGDAFTPTPTPAPTGIVAGADTTGILGLLDQKCTTKYDASGYAYIDANNNNLKDTGEVVASNVEVIIYLENVLQDDGSTKNIDLVTVKTDASGLWKVNICAGSYKLRVNPNTLPSNTKLVKDSIDLTVKSDQTNENINLALIDNASGFNWWWLVLPIGAIGILAYFYNGMKDSKVKLPRK